MIASDYYKEHTVGVTVQEGILTAPWHLIPPLIFVEDCVFLPPVLYFTFWNTIHYRHISFVVITGTPILIQFHEMRLKVFLDGGS